ncbi:MAG: retropepsin-like aspartic protease [Bryobacteraceae bacterium]|jgi:predicted aspartyl protease
MRLACFLFTLAAASAAAQDRPVRPGVLLKASLAGHALILNDVFLNGTGPYRMLIDTGNASSIVRPEIARRLNLKAAYAVEQACVAGVRRVPVAILDEVRAGSVSDRSVEAMIGDVFQPSVDGVLGESWLVRHDYLLDYRNRRVALDAAAAGSGVRVPLRSPDGLPVVVASVDGRARELVLDSGSSDVVLFEKPALDGALTARLDANGGVVPAQNCTVRFSLAGARDRLMDAVRIDVHGLGPGLLPASAFASVFVSNREGFVEFSR